MTDHDDLEQDDLEQRVTASLDDQAGAVHVRPDAGDLFVRVQRRARRRQQFLGAALALALVVGPVTGYVVGDGGPTEPGVAAADGGGDAGSTDTTPPATDDQAPTMTTIAGDHFSSDGAAASSAPYGYGYGQPLDRVGVVTLGDMVVRVYRSQNPAPDYGHPTWEPPAGCFATGSLVAEASTEAAVNLVGVAEGDPRWLVIGTTDADAATVRFSDGQTVEAAMLGDVFVATTPAPAPDPSAPSTHEPTATVVAGGAEVPIRAWSGPVDEEFYRQCEPPPPALPEAGEQPGDPEAARAAIREAYAIGYGGGQDEAQRDAFEDPAQLEERFAALDANESFDQYRGQLTAVVGEIVFDTPTHAWLFYDLEPVLTDVVGEAVLTDRGWKVANATICQDMARAGTPCDPDETG